MSNSTFWRQSPDLFELRLDCLLDLVDQLENKLSKLRRPIIITARHSHEGGANKLSLRKRLHLLSRFLDRADYVDVELRSASALRPLLALARKKKVRRIISFHDFKSTPHLRILVRKGHAAKSYGADIFKVATRTDTPAQLARLLNFMATKSCSRAADRRSITCHLAHHKSKANYRSMCCVQHCGVEIIVEKENGSEKRIRKFA